MYKCPICRRVLTLKQDMITHVESVHKDQVPEDLEGGIPQFIYMNKHNGRTYGLCRICGKPTKWNLKTERPHMLCDDPECAAKNKKIYETRMLNIYGKTSLMDEPEQLKKMLANRRISGTYIWSDGIHKFTYTGMYEKYCIEWLDKVMDIDPNTVQMPGPVVKYDLDGQPAYWITDMYLTDFNLVVEIKDGANENTGENFAGTRHREKCKDAFMQSQAEFNYVKVTHKNALQLVKAMTDIKNSGYLDDDDKGKKKPIIIIND